VNDELGEMPGDVLGEVLGDVRGEEACVVLSVVNGRARSIEGVVVAEDDEDTLSKEADLELDGLIVIAGVSLPDSKLSARGLAAVTCRPGATRLGIITDAGWPPMITLRRCEARSLGLDGLSDLLWTGDPSASFSFGAA
jgi:hypothetical protein